MLGALHEYEIYYQLFIQLAAELNKREEHSNSGSSLCEAKTLFHFIQHQKSYVSIELNIFRESPALAIKIHYSSRECTCVNIKNLVLRKWKNFAGCDFHLLPILLAGNVFGKTESGIFQYTPCHHFEINKALHRFIKIRWN